MLWYMGITEAVLVGIREVGIKNRVRLFGNCLREVLSWWVSFVGICLGFL